MSFFTVEEIETPVLETYEDGEYTVELLDVEKKSNNFDGDYIEIQRQFLGSQYEGKIWTKKYKICSDNQMIRHIAKQDISKLAVNVAKIQAGEELQPEHLIGKITKIVVKNEQSKNGNTFSNIKKEELVENSTSKETAQTIVDNHAINGIAGSGMQPLQAPVYPSDALNDQVPF